MAKRWIIMLAVCAVCLAMQETAHAGIIQEGGWQFNIVENDDLIAVDIEVINSTDTNTTNMTEIKLVVKKKADAIMPADYKWNAVICGEDPKHDFKKEEEVTKFFFFKTKEETDLVNVNLSEEQYKIDNKIPDKWCEKTKRKGYPFKLSETNEAFEKEIIIKVPVNVTEFRMYVGNGSVVIDIGVLDITGAASICKDSNNDLHTFYHGSFGKFYHSISTDEGATWTEQLAVDESNEDSGIVCSGGDDILGYYIYSGDLKGVISTDGGSSFGSSFIMADLESNIELPSCEADGNGVIHCAFITSGSLYYVNSTAWDSEVAVNTNANDQTDNCDLVVSPNNCVYLLGQGVDDDDLDYWSRCLNGFGDANRVEIDVGGGYATGSTISAAMVNKSGTLKMYVAWIDSGDLQFCHGTPGSAFTCSEIDADPSYYPSLVASQGSVNIIYLGGTDNGNEYLKSAYSLIDSISFNLDSSGSNIYGLAQSRGSWFPASNRVTNRHEFVYLDFITLYYDYLSIASGTNTAPSAPTDITGFPASLTVGNVLNVTASGSTDVDGDTVSYRYKFVNVDDNTIKQNYSTTKTYTVQASDYEDYIRVYVKATDGTANSSEYSETDYVEGSNYQYWRQDDNTTKVWIKGNWSTTSKRISWTNTSSTYAANGDNVFVFFDNFAGSSLNTSVKWTETGVTRGTQAVSGGYLTISGTGNQWNIHTKTPTIIKGVGRVIYRWSPEYTGTINMVTGVGNPHLYTTSYSPATLAFTDKSTTNNYFYSTLSGTSYTIPGTTTVSNTYHNVELRMFGSSGKGYFDGVNISTFSSTHVRSNINYSGVIYYHSTQRGSKYDYFLVTKINSTEPTVTCNQTGKYCDVVMSSGSVSNYQVTLPISTTGNLKLYEATAPTAPTDITGFPTTLFVGNVLNVTASGAYDANGDTLTYYYKFYNVNDTTIRQNWSTTKTYTTQASDSNDVIRVYTKAYDGGLYSGEYYEDDIVEVATVEFAIGYPSTGCTSGVGSTDEDVACERCAFVTTDLTGAANQTQIGCEGQDSSTGFYVISNTGNVAVSWRVKMNATMNTAKFRHKVALTSGGYQATCSGNVTTGCAYVENTTQKLLVSNLAVDGQSELWAWADFINVYPSDTATYTMTSNVTQT